MDWLWSEWFWLRPGTTWDMMEPANGKPGMTSSTELYYMPVLACALLYLVRNHFLLPYVLSPIGKYYGVRSAPYKCPTANATLDRLYRVNRARPPHHLLETCVRELGWEQRQVERWLRQKALSQQMTTLEKFNDFGYQFFYFTSAVIMGLIVLPRQEYFWDIKKCFEDYPQTSLPLEVKMYLWLTVGFYMFQCMLIFCHTKRHDFYVMLTHHVASFIIMSFCYIAKFHRICSLAILLHDVVDIFMGFGKLFNYCGKTLVSDIMFACFVLVWLPTRLFVFPVYILHGTMFVAAEVYGSRWPCQYFLNAVNLVLLSLHCIWTYELFAAIKHKMAATGAVQDTRSSPEELSADENKNHIKRTH